MWVGGGRGYTCSGAAVPQGDDGSQVLSAVFLGQELCRAKTKHRHGEFHDLAEGNGGESQPESQLSADVRDQVLGLWEKMREFSSAWGKTVDVKE